MENNLNLYDPKDDEFNKKIPISLEFYGLPGCGKSTISHIVAKKLRNAGYNVNELTYVLDHEYSKGMRKTFKLLYSCKFFLENNKLFRKIKYIILKCKGRIRVNQIINVMYKCWRYNSSGKYDFLVWDEGIMQSAVSISVDDAPEYSGIIAAEILETVAGKCKVIGIYLDFPIELAVSRMKIRNTKDSRADKLQEQEKELFLENYQKGLCTLEYCIHITDYEMQLEEMAQMIVQYILKEKNL